MTVAGEKIPFLRSLDSGYGKLSFHLSEQKELPQNPSWQKNCRNLRRNEQHGTDAPEQP